MITLRHGNLPVHERTAHLVAVGQCGQNLFNRDLLGFGEDHVEHVLGEIRIFLVTAELLHIEHLIEDKLLVPFI